MNSRERIEVLLDYLGIGPKILAEQAGLKDTRIMDIKRGKVQNIAYPVADAISGKFHQISKEWLLTGEGDMLVQDTTDDSKIKIIATPAEVEQELLREELKLMRQELSLMREEHKLMREEFTLMRQFISRQHTDTIIGIASEDAPTHTPEQ